MFLILLMLMHLQLYYGADREVQRILMELLNQECAVDLLPFLSNLHEKPPSLYISTSLEVENSLQDQSELDPPYSTTVEGSADMDVAIGGIDWNISADDGHIDWDVGQPEVSVDDGFYSYEIIDAHKELQESENYDVVLSDNISIIEEGVLSKTTGQSYAGISALKILKSMQLNILIHQSQVKKFNRLSQ